MPHKIVRQKSQGSLTCKLPSTLPIARIIAVLGQPLDACDVGDNIKTIYEWSVTVDGHPLAIWDYKGFRWSCYDPDSIVWDLFPELWDKPLTKV